MPCPSAVAVLLVCLQLKAFGLGVAMVAAFSVGLAATPVAIGVSVAGAPAELPSTGPASTAGPRGYRMSPLPSSC